MLCEITISHPEVFAEVDPALDSSICSVPKVLHLKYTAN